MHRFPMTTRGSLVSAITSSQAGHTLEDSRAWLKTTLRVPTPITREQTLPWQGGNSQGQREKKVHSLPSSILDTHNTSNIPYQGANDQHTEERRGWHLYQRQPSLQRLQTEQRSVQENSFWCNEYELLNKSDSGFSSLQFFCPPSIIVNSRKVSPLPSKREAACFGYGENLYPFGSQNCIRVSDKCWGENGRMPQSTAAMWHSACPKATCCRITWLFVKNTDPWILPQVYYFSVSGVGTI